MNQILSTDNNQKKNKRSGQMIDMRKVVIIFSILILIFAIIIVGVKIFGIIKEKSKNNNDPVALLNKPTISIDKADNICTLTVSYDEGLEKVTYYWNEEDELVRNMNGSTIPFTTQIIIPEGDYNTLYVEAIGIDGSINNLEQVFAVEDVQDKNKPKITWFYNEETRIIDIIAESKKGIKNLTYQWEGEEQVIIESTEEKQTKLSTTIDAKRGTNEITITATDLEEKTQTKNDIIQGIYAPVFSVQLINNKTIAINVFHDMGFKKVVIDVNGAELVYDETNPQYSAEITNINTSIDVNPGTVTVKISAYTLEEEEKEYTYEASTQI